jgi:hypothetical protein
MSTTHAKDFLARVLPWPDGPDAPGYCNVHWSFNGTRKDGTSAKFWGGRATKTPDEAVRTIQWVLSRPDTLDVYCCMSAQSQAEQKTTAKGHTYLNAMRRQDLALGLKSLFIDVDVKEGAYPDTQTALVAFRQFLDDTGMPMPSVMVGTGSGGFHVHWVFPEALAPSEWQALANGLAQATKEHGLHCDQQCTIDSARILRVPGTFNKKGSVPKPVTLMAQGPDASLDEVRAILGKYVSSSPLPVVGPRTPGLNDDLAGGLDVNARPVPIDGVARVCGFVADALATGGANNPNPLWFMTTSLATFTEEGRAAAHDMAKGHPGYDPKTTDALFDRVMAERQKRDIGWPKCEKISLMGCTQCSTCPLLKQGKSPLNHALPVATTTPPPAADETATVAPANANTLPLVLPSKHFRAKDGKIHVEVLLEDGTTTSMPVCQYPIWSGWVQDNPWTLHFIAQTHQNVRRQVELPHEALMAKDGAFLKLLGRQGMTMPDLQAKAFREFLLSWITKLKETRDAVVTSVPFGWSVTNGMVEGFSYSGRVWTASGDRPSSNPDPVLAHQYTPKGDLAPWVEAARMITNQKRPGLNAILAASFGAPLVRFTGQPGAMISAYSPESGIGKTTAMRIAQAVWADPVRALQSLSDTANSVINKVGAIKHLPLFWDEMKGDVETQRFVGMAFQLTQGKEKSRLQADVTQREPGTWQTLLVTASNDSLIDPINKVTKSTTAGVYRIFEYALQPGTVGQIEQGVVSRAVARLTDNYGAAGVVYAKFLGANHERVRKEVAEFQDRLVKVLDAGNDERFWIAAVTAIVMGARYANELKLTQIDLKELFGFCREVFDKMRAEVRETPTDMKNKNSISTILQQFLTATRARNTLITNKVHTSKGKPKLEDYKILSDTSRLDGIWVHIGREDKVMRIASTAFSRWLADNGYPNHALRKALMDEFGATYVNGRLGGGTTMASTLTEYLIHIDMNHDALKGLVE